MRRWTGGPEPRHGSWQVQSTHLDPSEIKSILNSVAFLISLRQFSSSGVLGQESGRRSEPSRGSHTHTHTQFHAVMRFKAVAPLALEGSRIQEPFIYLLPIKPAPHFRFRFRSVSLEAAPAPPRLSTPSPSFCISETVTLSKLPVMRSNHWPLKHFL